MTVSPLPHLDRAEFAFRRGSLLTLLGAVLVVSVVTLSVQAFWNFSAADQLLLGLLGLKNAALLAWLWRSPRHFRLVGLIELGIGACTAIVRLYVTLHSPPSYSGLGGYAPWMILSYLAAFLVLSPRSAVRFALTQYSVMAAVVFHYALDAQVPAAMKTGLGNSLLQTMLMHATFIAYLAGQQRLLGHYVRALLSAKREASLAQIDALTELPNRRQLTTWLRESLGGPEDTSVILFDLDHFKRVNDTHGHDVGDAVLQHVAHTMRRSVRQHDRVGRWGGEEFLIIVQGSAVTAQHVAQRLRELLKQAPHLQAGVITVSCGVAQALPGERLEDLLRRADEAMYGAKRAGRDTVTTAA
ncbi:GGDEF domain-containing protein [Deinococcus taeanensis]|uniref:GGDEF domain-containing protein n=1 Tax=Deinococcus taeanensis TaxID=2737050 RepID=UPI001CDC9018|nr:GGDEF domain-containing protein [Deinococcus taeanensis]UBV42407.1 GGDEF domain-containing protein [Deinococcus taeanensis]